ncbi:MAG TPA: 4Fe-4S ferredoxin [Gammaproteobacteria bacterium]|jgi:tetrathionate reductase subunit B|nr:MAG: 4Fe-4S ferredoxin [Candidatus Thioglobus sp. MED-G23]HAU41233.1 4Fe-4S ferredoxin [Gammaproteobacteria bacterium]HBP84376.1 4Fe-4S ferredoxin [Gammaproteobacteria bacterium]|tara:strand:- start:4180 stop:4932 length:753 start_codon:yes stop_codon:yes gene_type:complete
MSQSQPPSSATTRRRFFTQAGAGVALLALAPGVRLAELAVAASDDEPVTDAHRWGLWVDTSRCASGCDACVSACNDEHGLTGMGRPETDAQWIRKVDLKDETTGREVSLPLMCQHCEEPPCVDVCPTGASFRREDGIVLVDKHICIGCRYCMMACPFHARSFIHEDLSGQKTHSPRGKGVVESCTLCVHRVDENRAPACVDACADAGHHALVFGDLNDAQGPLASALAREETDELRSDLKLNTAVRYSGV